MAHGVEAAGEGGGTRARPGQIDPGGKERERGKRHWGR